jgi:phosphoenolpyruvate carboxykinase (GTP)
VVPGTNYLTNPNAMATIRANTIFTNVALTADGTPWWEGRSETPPAGLTDWQGRAWDGKGPAAHPNSRFTAPASQCPSLSPRWEDPQGVPISAILFGGRRARVDPLVYQAFDWEHGVFAAATTASETTAAATGQVGVVRRDPMAMLPFCGYNMADYFAHWLRVGRGLTRPPALFHVNWFRKGKDGRFLWPGFGENLRVLLWMVDRIHDRPVGTESPIGIVPRPGALNLSGLDVSPEDVDALLRVDSDEWADEVAEIRAFFSKFGDRLPPELPQALERVARRLGL